MLERPIITSVGLKKNNKKYGSDLCSKEQMLYKKSFSVRSHEKKIGHVLSRIVDRWTFQKKKNFLIAFFFFFNKYVKAVWTKSASNVMKRTFATSRFGLYDAAEED